MATDCVSKRKATIMRAAVIGAIRSRKITQRRVGEIAGVRYQHVYDVLHAGKALSARMHAAFRRALGEAFPDLKRA